MNEKRVVVLWEAKEVDYTVLARVREDLSVIEFVCAYKYDSKDKSWAQGHYFNTLPSAMEYMKAVYDREEKHLIKEQD